MFCVLKFYFVDFYGMFTSSPTWRLKMHVLCKVGKNIIIQNKTLLVIWSRYSTAKTSVFAIEILNASNDVIWHQKILMLNFYSTYESLWGGGALNFFSGRGVRPGFPKCRACELTFASEKGGLWAENFQIWGLVSWNFPNLGACELKFGWKLRL